jgi:hypothetical protein
MLRGCLILRQTTPAWQLGLFPCLQEGQWTCLGVVNVLHATGDMLCWRWVGFHTVMFSPFGAREPEEQAAGVQGKHAIEQAPVANLMPSRTPICPEVYIRASEPE